MKQLARRASLVVVLLFLAPVGTASAECAWVLWNKAVTQNSTRWERTSAHSTRNDCVDVLPKLVAMNESRLKVDGYTIMDPKVGGMVAGSRGQGSDARTLVFFAECWPDTVDPSR